MIAFRAVSLGIEFRAVRGRYSQMWLPLSHRTLQPQLQLQIPKGSHFDWNDEFHGGFFSHMIRAIKISKPFALLSVFLHCRLLDVCLETGLVSDYLVIAWEGLVVPAECEPRMLSSLWMFPSTVVLSGSLFTKNLLIFEECRSFPTHSFPLREGRVS